MSVNKVDETDMVWSSQPEYQGIDRTSHKDITGYIGNRPFSQDPKTYKITYTDGKLYGGRKSTKRRKSTKSRKSTKRRKSMKKLHRRK